MSNELAIWRFAHYSVYSLPGSRVLVLRGAQPWPAHLDNVTAVLAWSGRASCVLAAMEAAF